MALISCGECPCLIILPIIHALLIISNIEVYKYTEYGNHPIIDCLLSNLLLCFSFVPMIFTIYICNSKKKSDKKRHKYKNAKIKRPVLTTIIIALLYEIVNLLHSIFSNKLYVKKDIIINDYILELFFIVIALKIISRELIYIHQQISIAIIFLLGVGFYVIEKFYNNDLKSYIFIIIISIIKQILCGISIVFIKNLTEQRKFSFFKLLFIFGITGLLIDLFTLIFSSRIKCGDSLSEICSVHIYENRNVLDINDTIPINNISNITNITDTNNTNPLNFNESDVSYYLDNLTEFIKDLKEDMQNQNLKVIVLTVVYKIFGIIIFGLLILIIQKLSSSYTYFTNIYLTIFFKAKEFLFREKKDYLFLMIQIGLALIIFIFTLVFNENIELNCCGLSDYTKKNKLKRNDYDEQRKSDWISSKLGDADATIVDDCNNSLDDIGHGDNENSDGTVGTINML